jgi:DNA invertase Pin-like site-specific DNA recombinase
MAERVPFVVAELAPDVDPFVLHLYAALAEKERERISERARAAVARAKGKGVVRATALILRRLRPKVPLRRDNRGCVCGQSDAANPAASGIGD